MSKGGICGRNQEGTKATTKGTRSRCSSKQATIVCCLTTGLLLIACYMFYENESLHGYRQHQMEQSRPTPKQYGGTLGLQLRGRLGNQMFQYASLLGLASMMKFEKVIIEGGEQLRDTFKLENDRVEFRNVPPHWNVVRSTLSGMFDETLTQLNNTSELRIEAFLESWKYFLQIESIIKKDFTFKSHVLSNAKNILDTIIVKHKFNISFPNATYVGVHIRRGDLLSVAAVQKGLMVAPMEYVVKAMGIIRIMYGPNIIFIICSDDIPLVKKAISQQGHTSSYSFMFMENNQPNVDLAVLSLCNQTIATTGTFSWWGAWLAGGTTIFYKHQARQGSEYRQRFNYDDFFYPHWILLE